MIWKIVFQKVSVVRGLNKTKKILPYYQFVESHQQPQPYLRCLGVSIGPLCLMNQQDVIHSWQWMIHFMA